MQRWRLRERKRGEPQRGPWGHLPLARYPPALTEISGSWLRQRRQRPPRQAVRVLGAKNRCRSPPRPPTTAVPVRQRLFNDGSQPPRRVEEAHGPDREATRNVRARASAPNPTYVRQRGSGIGSPYCRPHPHGPRTSPAMPWSATRGGSRARSAQKGGMKRSTPRAGKPGPRRYPAAAARAGRAGSIQCAAP